MKIKLITTVSLIGMLLIGVFLFAVSAPFGYGQTEEWVARYNGPGNSFDFAYAMTVDSAGKI
jgi:hypothetical protein